MTGNSVTQFDWPFRIHFVRDAHLFFFCFSFMRYFGNSFARHSHFSGVYDYRIWDEGGPLWQWSG